MCWRRTDQGGWHSGFNFCGNQPWPFRADWLFIYFVGISMRARESLLQYFLKTTGSKIESLTCTNTLIPFITKKKKKWNIFRKSVKQNAWLKGSPRANMARSGICNCEVKHTPWLFSIYFENYTNTNYARQIP